MNTSINIEYKNKLDFVTEHCVLAVVFFLPLSPDFTNVFLGVGMLSWFAKMAVAKKLHFRATPFDKVVMLLVILSAISICNSPDKAISIYNYQYLMGRYILIYYLLVNTVHTEAQLKQVARALMASACAVTLYGFYQYFFDVKMLTGEWVDPEQFPELKHRVFSTLKNPNLLAGYLVTMISIAGGFCCKAENKKSRLLWFGLIIIFAICLVLTYSRGAWVSILAVITVYGVLYNRRVFWLLALLPLAALFNHDLVMERLLSILNPTDTSAGLRWALWESTIAMIADHPLIGVGWGAYRLVYPEYDFYVNNASTIIFHAHNMYLQIAAEIGIPGLFAFLYIMYGHAYKALQLIKKSSIPWVKGLMLGLCSATAALTVSGFTDYVLFNIQLSMLFWLLNAIIIVAWLHKEEDK